MLDRRLAQQDRRAKTRLSLKARVRARKVDPESGLALDPPVCAGWTLDVSVGGVRFGSRKVLPLNSFVELDIDCTRPMESFKLRGQVGWLSREGDGGQSIGLFISETSRERLTAWRRMLERRGLDG
ncbi:MAG: PilZ domain-containing protein [Verrucomicrobia bacterium]|nr:PilZ domain-containing protein [Verrucomicrobiota bacterium]